MSPSHPILTFLGNGPKTLGQLRACIQMDHDQLEEQLSDLVARGRVERRDCGGVGVYCIAEGRQRKAKRVPVSPPARSA